MGLFKRFGDIISANINDLVDRMEDPEKGLRQAIREMEEAIQTATTETSKVLANQKRLEKELTRARSDVESWNLRAEQSVDRNDDASAREALTKAAEAGSLVSSVESQLGGATEASNVLKDQLTGMREKMAEAKRSLATLSARQKAADIRKQAITATNQAGDVIVENSAFEKFDRLREKVEIAEAEAEALAELAGHSSPSSPPLNQDIEAKLTALKKKREQH
jgi:phage shock protein A